MVLEYEREHPSRWAAVSSVAAKMGCTAQTLNEGVKKKEVAGTLKALECENRELRQADEIPRKASAYSAMAELDRRPRHLCLGTPSLSSSKPCA
jgi:transposase-like protein